MLKILTCLQSLGEKQKKLILHLPYFKMQSQVTILIYWNKPIKKNL